jgi:hypothetical protein
MNCKLAGLKQGFEDIPQQAKSPARHGGRVRDLPVFIGSIRVSLWSLPTKT